jgi:hypothetical protein
MPERDDHGLERVTLLLDGMAAPYDEPAPELERRMLARIESTAGNGHAPAEPVAARTRRRWAWRPWAPAAAVIAVAALVGTWAVIRSADDDPSSPTPPLELRADLRAPVGGAAHGRAEVVKTGIGRVIDFRSGTLPILPKGEYYELWFVGPGDTPANPNRISAGTFHPDARGRSFVTFAAAVEPRKYPVVSVTAEPGDGDPRATGPEVLRSRP